jgi:hypothetical protein
MPNMQLPLHPSPNLSDLMCAMNFLARSRLLLLILLYEIVQAKKKEILLNFHMDTVSQHIGSNFLSHDQLDCRFFPL